MMVEIDDFLPPAQCDALAAYLRANVRRLGRPNVEPFFSYRQIAFPAVDSVSVRDTMSQVKSDIAAQVGPNHWPDYTDLVLWREGMDMGAHVDNLPPHFPHRQYSALVYLNTCEGGETFFPDLGKAVAPRTGRMILFPSGERHGVTRITKGERYTLACWLTDDRTKWEAPVYAR